jgi:2-C-methyl-D-erythritol 2,4-cyclodiphosphate synthase
MRSGEGNMRVGQGYDLHRLVGGRSLVIGGVAIPFEKGLLGHSDADVLLHALSDALLGAAGLGDIGQHFPDTDSQFEGISSMTLLEKAFQMVRDKGYKVGNVDATVVAEAPKMAPYKKTMEANIASVLQIDLEYVNVKATTTEGLGPIGDGEAIAATCVVNLI